jgi:hypothetical protein
MLLKAGSDGSCSRVLKSAPSSPPFREWSTQLHRAAKHLYNPQCTFITVVYDLDRQPDAWLLRHVAYVLATQPPSVAWTKCSNQQRLRGNAPQSKTHTPGKGTGGQGQGAPPFLVISRERNQAQTKYLGDMSARATACLLLFVIAAVRETMGVQRTY